MYKTTPKKAAVVKNPRLYFITNNQEDDLKKLDEYFKDNKPPFIDKVHKTKCTTKDITNTFINIKLNIELTEETFKKLSEKINKILDSKNKTFYSDSNNRFVYIHNDIINNINESLSLFIQNTYFFSSLYKRKK